MKKIVVFLFLAMFCVLFWNAIRWIHTTATAAPFSISFLSDVCLPAVIGVTVGFMTTLRQKG